MFIFLNIFFSSGNVHCLKLSPNLRKGAAVPEKREEEGRRWESEEDKKRGEEEESRDRERRRMEKVMARLGHPIG